MSLKPIPNGTLYILTPFNDILEDKNVYFTGDAREDTNGFVLLLFETILSFNSTKIRPVLSSNKKCWYVKDIIIKQQHAQHFKSRGEYFSFGVSGRCYSNNGISLGEYISKGEILESTTRTTLTTWLQDFLCIVRKYDAHLIKETTFGLEQMKHLLRDKVDSEGNPVHVGCLKSVGTIEELLHFFSAQMNSNAGT
eukprot:3827972-Ditylum_brightwellii.AAC.1